MWLYTLLHIVELLWAVRGLINGWALGKLTGCVNDFAHWAWFYHLAERYSHKKSSVKLTVLPTCQNWLTSQLKRLLNGTLAVTILIKSAVLLVQLPVKLIGSDDILC